MDQIEIHITNVPEISERRRLSTSNEEEEIQKNKIRTFQSNHAKYKYLLNFKRWPIFDFLDPEFILQIHMAMVLKHEGVLIVTRDKMVYAFGNNINKQLGIGCTNMTLQPNKVEVLCGKNIKKFVFWQGEPCIMALTKEGEVYSWSYDPEVPANTPDDHVKKGFTIPTQMSLLREKHIIDIKCSSTHCLALADDGNVYIWGYLGIGNINEYTPKEEYLYIDVKQVHFNEKKIVCIACGYFFSMAVSNEGKLYSWGPNPYSALEIDSTLPESHDLNIYQVTSLSNKIIVKVICGHVHTIALTNKGKIYTWGSNYFGQLGLNISRSISPVLLDMPNMKKVLDIAIGQKDANIALCDDGCIYMWGMHGTAEYFGRKFFHPTITAFSNMHEALMFDDLPLMIFADHLKYMDGELDILECWETSFDDPSTSDLTIQVEEQSIHVHKAILKSRSSYFRTMFQDDSVENNESVIQHSKYSYIVYKAFLKYLYTDVIDLSIERLLELLDLAIVYCESKLERYCIQEIKRGITIQNVALLRSTAEKYNKVYKFSSVKMDEIETHITNVPEISESRKLSSNEEEEMQKSKIRTFQSNFAKDKYLQNFKRWPIFDFLEPEFILQIHMALVLKDEGILIATRDKMVYAFGHNKDKLLGIGCTSMTLQPKEVEVLCGKNLIKFVFWKKGSRIIALTKEGEVYSLGYNEEKLKQALNSYDDHVRKGLIIPTQMRLLRKKHIIDIKCNKIYCLALTDDGDVYTWGYSDIIVISNNIDPETYFSTDINWS